MYELSIFYIGLIDYTITLTNSYVGLIVSYIGLKALQIVTMTPGGQFDQDTRRCVQCNLH